MKNISNSKKTNLFKKIFVKICRKLGFELIDQSNFTIQTLNKSADQSLSSYGKKNISIPLGEEKITRPVRSLDIIIKTCTSVNLVTQNKKRIFESSKSDYTFRTINSILKSLTFDKELKKKINLKIHIIDHNSNNNDLKKIEEIFSKYEMEYNFINLDVEKISNIKTINKDNHIIETNMKATMASIMQSFFVAKDKCEDLIYFVEDDYIHKIESLSEMIKTYERISSLYNKEFFLCPVDYPFLYKKTDDTKIILGDKYHWRTINETLLTFMTSRKLILKYWEELINMSRNEHSPFEKPLHSIYENEYCFSPIPSLALHCTNVNSAFGLSPNVNWKRIWEENEI